MNDYERVARIIRFLDAAHLDQPGLDELAARSGLSRFHFHRLFSRWAGVTPKDFLQCLTAGHARQQLRQGASVLEAALAAGLSSPGRLHDLCVTLEAATPGEIKAGGKGWIIEAGFAESPFGLCCIAQGPRGICHLAFVEASDPQLALAPVAEAWPRARLRRDDAAARRLAAQIFRPIRNPKKPEPIRAFVQGTPFQLRVWRALLCVPPGALVSYGALAAAVNHPNAARAIGSAVGRNPLAFLIPCHRVIRETGIVGEYRWGRERKQVMLAWEAAFPRQREVAEPFEPFNSRERPVLRPASASRQIR